MSIEDILYEAEKVGLRVKVLEGVHKIRQNSPSTPLRDAYETAWEEERRRIMIHTPQPARLGMHFYF